MYNIIYFASKRFSEKGSSSSAGRRTAIFRARVYTKEVLLPLVEERQLRGLVKDHASRTYGRSIRFSRSLEKYAKEKGQPGCGSAWLERLVWDQEVAGSNPVTPILKEMITCGCSSMVEH